MLTWKDLIGPETERSVAFRANQESIRSHSNSSPFGVRKLQSRGVSVEYKSVSAFPSNITYGKSADTLTLTREPT